MLRSFCGSRCARLDRARRLQRSEVTHCSHGALSPCAGSPAEFENDFATAFALRCVRNRRLRLRQWISFLDFRLKQSTLRHFKKPLESFYPLLRRSLVVPFVYPKAAEVEVLENEQTIWNPQRLQTHRTISHDRCTGRER